MDVRLWIVFGVLAFALVFFGLFFGLLLPRMIKMREKQQKMMAEERLRKQQTKTAIEKEKLERDLMKQKMAVKAEAEIAEMKQMQPKFCQYCGAKFAPGSVNCPSCGAKLKQ